MEVPVIGRCGWSSFVMGHSLHPISFIKGHNLHHTDALSCQTTRWCERLNEQGLAIIPKIP